MHKLGWVGLDQLSEAFEGRHSQMKARFEYDPRIMVFEEPNCLLKTDRLWPVREKNTHREGLGKGHVQAIDICSKLKVFELD